MGFIQNDLQVFGGIFSGNIPHGFHVALDQGQRRAQIVADVGNQFPLGLFYLAEIPGRLRKLAVQLGDFPVGVRVTNRRKLALTQGAGRLGRLNNGPGDPSGQDAGQKKADQQKSGGQHPQFAADGLHRGGDGR